MQGVQMYVFSVLISCIVGFGAPNALDKGDDFQSQLVYAFSGTNLLIPDEKNRLNQVHGRHELRMTWEIKCSDSDSLYCFYPTNYSVESEDDQGEPFVRAKVMEQLPPHSVLWMGKGQDGSSAERVRSKQQFGIQATCDRTPPIIGRLVVGVPAWKAIRVEYVTVPVTEEKVWQELPNGSRVMVVIESDYGKFKNMVMYREHSISENLNPAPPPFRLSKFAQEDGSELKQWATQTKNGALVPSNPAEANDKRVAFIKQRFDPETESPAAAILAVVLEYEQLELEFMVENTPLGDAPPRDQIAP